MSLSGSRETQKLNLGRILESLGKYLEKLLLKNWEIQNEVINYK